jgi:site-specific DNA-methyltransferase (adenine-specific)
MNSPSDKKILAERNRTITLSPQDVDVYKKRLLRIDRAVNVEDFIDRTINQDVFEIVKYLPDQFIDLLFIDPPYNMNKRFNTIHFKKTEMDDYTNWVDEWLSEMTRLLKPTASVYICSEWQSSTAVHLVAQKYFKVRNRITWEREKGRGALSNWKNCTEDIWYCTVSDDYYFNVDSVKLKRKVIAPYTNNNGEPKDWERKREGNFRLSYPSNIWTDLTIPFWSMPENTEHPTQKPEKLLAKIVLASSREGEIIFDPFLGSGTSCVVAKKLKRHFGGVEIDEKYCLLTEKRLHLADIDPTIQGYNGGVFWERNTLHQQNCEKKHNNGTDVTSELVKSESVIRATLKNPHK